MLNSNSASLKHVVSFDVDYDFARKVFREDANQRTFPKGQKQFKPHFSETITQPPSRTCN